MLTRPRRNKRTVTDKDLLYSRMMYSSAISALSKGEKIELIIEALKFLSDDSNQVSAYNLYDENPDLLIDVSAIINPDRYYTLVDGYDTDKERLLNAIEEFKDTYNKYYNTFSDNQGVKQQRLNEINNLINRLKGIKIYSSNVVSKPKPRLRQIVRV